jgi:hypothetical protein
MSNERYKLIQELNEEVDYSFTWGRNNNVTDVCLSILAVFASLAAAVLAAKSEWFSPLLVATFAAVPAACTSLRQIVAFQRRSYWHFEHGSRLKALALELEFANAPNLEEIAKKRGEIEIEMERAWPRVIGSGHGDHPGGGVKKGSR